MSSLKINSQLIYLLNNQISVELEASIKYLNMASWCQVNSFDGAAEFFYKQSEEERSHMIRIVKFLSEMNTQVVHPSLSTTPSKFSYSSLKSLFEISLVEEQKVSDSIHAIATECYDKKDFSSLNFIQWFIAEQIEEELKMTKILSMFERFGDSPLAVGFIDKELNSI